MAEISTKQRKALPRDEFADPANRAYPIHDASHARNAMARLEQQKDSLSPSKYQEIKRNVLRAYKKFGISHEGQPVKSRGLPMRRGLRMRIGSDGAVEVAHHYSDTDGEARLCRAAELIAALSDDARPVWIQLAKVGSFAGHPAGPFKLDPAVFDEIIRNFRATENKHVPIDFEHASEADATAGEIPVVGAPAQGWIRDLDNRGGEGLWALVEWGDLARDYIRSGKYRYISPAVRFGARDRVSGKQVGARLTSAGLTNQPFLDGMAPLAAKDKLVEQALYSAHEMMPKVRAALKLSPLASPTECSDELSRLRALCEMADAPGAVVQGVDLGDYIPTLRDMLSMSPSATYGDLLDAVAELIEAIAGDGDAEETMTDDTDTADMADNSTESEAQAMSDQETAIKLKDAEVKVDDLAAKLKEVEARLSEQAVELSELRAFKAERMESDLRNEVDIAYATYKDAKKLSDKDREHMLAVCKAAPDAFRALYPRIPAAQAHLLRSVATSRAAEPAPSKPVNEINLVRLADKIEKDGKVSREEALIEAYKHARASRVG